eukprot:gene632-2068_t
MTSSECCSDSEGAVVGISFSQGIGELPHVNTREGAARESVSTTASSLHHASIGEAHKAMSGTSAERGSNLQASGSGACEDEDGPSYDDDGPSYDDEVAKMVAEREKAKEDKVEAGFQAMDELQSGQLFNTIRAVNMEKSLRLSKKKERETAEDTEDAVPLETERATSGNQASSDTAGGLHLPKPGFAVVGMGDTDEDVAGASGDFDEDVAGTSGGLDEKCAETFQTDLLSAMLPDGGVALNFDALVDTTNFATLQAVIQQQQDDNEDDDEEDSEEDAEGETDKTSKPAAQDNTAHATRPSNEHRGSAGKQQQQQQQQRPHQPPLSLLSHLGGDRPSALLHKKGFVAGLKNHLHLPKIPLPSMPHPFQTPTSASKPAATLLPILAATSPEARASIRPSPPSSLKPENGSARPSSLSSMKNELMRSKKDEMALVIRDQLKGPISLECFQWTNCSGDEVQTLARAAPSSSSASSGPTAPEIKCKPSPVLSRFGKSAPDVTGLSQQEAAQEILKASVRTSKQAAKEEMKMSIKVGFIEGKIKPINIVMLEDVQPFIGIGLKLQEYGHRVRIASHKIYRQFVEGFGLEFYPLGGDPKVLSEYVVKHRGIMPGLDIKDALKQREQVKMILYSSWGACTEADPENMHKPFIADAIVANPPAYGHSHCAEKLNCPLHIVFTMPWTPTKAFPSPFARIKTVISETNSMAREAMNWLSYFAMEDLAWLGMSGLVKDFRQRVLGMKTWSKEHTSHALYHSKVPMTYIWSPSLVGRPKDWPSYCEVVGFINLEVNKLTKYKPPKDLSDFLAAGPPPIYIGFGSLVVNNPAKMTQQFLEAIKETGVRAIIQKGWGGLGAGMDKANPPAGVFLLEGNCAHDWLFEQCSAVIHHGGAGTTATGLYAGKPTFIVYFFGDQPFWGAACNNAGVGPEPVAIDDLSTLKIVNGLKELILPSRLTAALVMSEKMHQEDGITATHIVTKTKRVEGHDEAGGEHDHLRGTLALPSGIDPGIDPGKRKADKTSVQDRQTQGRQNKRPGQVSASSGTRKWIHM